MSVCIVYHIPPTNASEKYIYIKENTKMIKLTPQQCFELACDEYAKAKDIIADLTAKTKEISPQFNGDIAMRQFDFIVQAILLNIAVEDRDFCELEKVFIKNITEYADILITVNAIIKQDTPDWVDVEWDHINLLTPENKDKFAIICASVVEKYADEFTYFFAGIDVLDERDYYEELQGCLFHLIALLDAVDEGGIDDEAGADNEALRGLAIMQKLFKEKWDANTETFKKVLEEGSN